MGFVCVFVCLGYHSFGALEGPVPREEEEGEHGALTQFREEGVERREDLQEERQGSLSVLPSFFVCPLLPPDLDLTSLNVEGWSTSAGRG